MPTIAAVEELPHLVAKTSWLLEVGRAVLVGLVATAILAVIVAAIKPLRVRIVTWWRTRGWRDEALQDLSTHLANSVTFMTHLRDGVFQAFWRAAQEDDGDRNKIRERIRRNVLEPIRGVIPTIPGEEIKVVWF